MLSKNFKNIYRIFCINRDMVLCLLISVILISPFKSNAQWMPGLTGYGIGVNPMQSLLGYGLFGSQMQFPTRPGLGVNPMQSLLGYSSFVNPLQSLSGFGFGTNPMQSLLGYGLFGSQMQFPMGYGPGVNLIREAITDNGLISKIKDLDNGKTAQISKSDKINGYYEYIVISNDIVPLSILYNYPYQVDTNDFIVVVKCLLDEYEFVFATKAEGKSNKFIVSSSNTSYYTPSPTTTSYGGWPTYYPVSTLYGASSWLNGSGSIVPSYLDSLAYNGIGGLLGNINGLLGNINGSGTMQYLGQRINEAYLLPNLYSMFSGSIFSNPLTSLLLGNIPLYGRPTTIPSETTYNSFTLVGEPPRNGHFGFSNPGLSYSMNLMTSPSQSFLPPF